VRSVSELPTKRVIKFSASERISSLPHTKGDGHMPGKSGSKDKGNKEQKKKAKHSLKEKRKLKQEKKQKGPFMNGG
jgi:hypothetical protein